VLNKEIPFLRIGLPFCLGILTGPYLKPGATFGVAVLFLAISGFIISLFFNKYITNIIYGIALTVALWLAGLILYTNEKSQLSDLDPTEAEYLCTLSEFPEEKANTYRMIVRLNGKFSDKDKISLHGSMMIYMRKDPLIKSLIPGDIMKIRCSPDPIGNRGNPDEFDYRFYMENHGVKYFAFADREDILEHTAPKHRKLSHKALIARESIIGMYRARGITGDTLALVAAITLGQKSLLDPDQKQYFIKAGVMHIMAVSGLHAVILSMFVFNVLFFLKGRYSFLRSLITILFLWMFAFITGLTPSVLRATIMFTFLQGGTLMKRHVNSINSVLASAFILLLIRPSILFDAGFLLSYSAVIFIICFYREMYLKLDLKNWLADKVWQSAAVTIVAQAGTLPLTIMLFNRFPTWFILTNLIIVPVSSLLIVVGCLVPLTFPLEFISRPVAYVLANLTGVTGLLTEKAASLPYSTIDSLGMTSYEALLLFSFICILFWFLLNRRSVPVHYPVVALLLFTLLVTFRDISNKSSNEVIVYNTIGSPAIGVRTGRVLNLYSDTSLIQPEVLRHCATRRLKPDWNPIAGDFTIVVADTRLLITNNLTNKLLTRAGPDIVIFTGSVLKTETTPELPKRIRGLIITGNISSVNKASDKFRSEVFDTVHYCRKSGAFRLKI